MQRKIHHLPFKLKVSLSVQEAETPRGHKPIQLLCWGVKPALPWQSDTASLGNPGKRLSFPWSRRKAGLELSRFPSCGACKQSYSPGHLKYFYKRCLNLAKD